jgi:hypothetical protein
LVQTVESKEAGGLKRKEEITSSGSKKIRSEESDIKRVKLEKKPIQASAGMSVFEQLNQQTPAMSVSAPKLKLSDLTNSLKRKNSDPSHSSISSTVPSRAKSGVSPLDSLLSMSGMSYLKEKSPVEEKTPVIVKEPTVTISKKTGKPKKLVRFKPENEIKNVVYFGFNDIPRSVVRII